MPQSAKINIPKLTIAIVGALMPDIDDDDVKEKVGDVASKLANGIASQIQPILDTMNASVEANISIADDLTSKIAKLEAASGSAASGAGGMLGV